MAGFTPSPKMSLPSLALTPRHTCTSLAVHTPPHLQTVSITPHSYDMFSPIMYPLATEALNSNSQVVSKGLVTTIQFSK